MRCLNCKQDGIPVSLAESGNCPHCGVYFPSLLRNILSIGTIIHEGKYRIDYPLGQGGFGITYRGFHTVLEQELAIKEFYPDSQVLRQGKTGYLAVTKGSEDAYQRGKERFLREGKILAQLNHPNVVKIKDLFEENNTAYLVMELVKGQTLRDMLDKHPEKCLEEDTVEKVMNALVSSLEAVHQRNIYHLDLKPDNVLISNEGRLVLIDFGAARQGLNKNSKSVQAFTESYAAPEVILGDAVGSHSDLFELGMMLHEMLTGDLPLSVLARLFKQDELQLNIAEPWQSLLTEALKLQPDERPNSVGEWWESRHQLRIEINQEKSFSYTQLGYSLLEQGNIEDAINAFNTAIYLNPNNAAAHYNLGCTFRKKRQLKEAADSFRQALTLEPDYAKYLLNLGLVLYNDKKLEEAIEVYQIAIAINPNDAEACCNLGLALSDQGKLDEAIQQYRMAIAINPNFAEAYYNLGVALSKQGKLDEARQQYRKAHTINPNYALAHCNLGTALYEQGKIDEAIQQYRKAIAINPNNLAEAYYNLGNALSEQGKLYEAIQQYRKAIAINPSYALAHNPNNLAEAYYNLGNALSEQGKLYEAIQQYRMAIAINPSYALAYYNLGLALSGSSVLVMPIINQKQKIDKIVSV
jgi:tetratricopeptide (TPR) repeat protein